MDELGQPLPKESLSKTPSWISLGFVIGAFAVWMLPRETEIVVAPAPAPAAEEVPLGPPRLSEVESLFEAYGKHAIWENDTTEVQVYNPESHAFVDCYEVVRRDEKYYFRWIPRLTRRALDHGIPENLPLRFTESEASYQAFRQDVTEENMKRVRDSFNRAPAAAKPTPPPTPGTEVELKP